MLAALTFQLGKPVPTLEASKRRSMRCPPAEVLSAVADDGLKIKVPLLTVVAPV